MRTALFSSGFKLVVLDEADAMTADAQAALRRVVEQYSRNTRFCMICNYVTKIIPALQSRCTKFRFAPLQSSQVRSRVDHVIAAERINITPGGVDALLELGNGDMRRILNVLQAGGAWRQQRPARWRSTATTRRLRRRPRA